MCGETFKAGDRVVVVNSGYTESRELGNGATGTVTGVHLGRGIVLVNIDGFRQPLLTEKEGWAFYPEELERIPLNLPAADTGD